ncbi:MAG: hypothetical protein WBP93_03760 [Pyrinomonadaceae bacterium]
MSKQKNNGRRTTDKEQLLIHRSSLRVRGCGFAHLSATICRLQGVVSRELSALNFYQPTRIEL